MLYITGDTHGRQDRWTDPAYGIEGCLKAGDTIIVCGDFKYIFDDEKRKQEDAFLNELAEKPFRILFCDGKHENFPRLSAYPKEEWNGGRIHRIRPNILHLMRGQERVTYGHWYMGHLHLDMDLWRNQTVLWYQVRKLI